ncbi:MAG: AMP-binding protein [Pseudomonadota bacterium]
MSEAIANLAVHFAARAPSAVVGWRAGAAVDNAQFMARVWAWNALLRRQPGNDFALYLDDSIEFGAALLGAWQANKTVWLSADTLDASCATLRASVDGFLGEFPPACCALRPDENDGAEGGDARVLDSDFPALVVFTSGSTGAAQAIPKKLSQMASEVATLQLLFGAAAGDAAVLATVSHQHIYGLLFKVLWPLSAGRAIHALSINYPETLAQALAAGPCVLVASPAHLKRLPEHLDWQTAAGMLRAVYSSGGPLAADTAQASGRLLGHVPVEVFGSSETGGIAWRQRPLTPTGGSDEAWQVFPTVQWRLDPADGVLEVRSPHLPDDDWLRLADRAMASSAGRFMLLGRSDRIVKIEEKRISLDAMEAALLATGLALEARVALCDPEPGQRQKLAAFIVATPAGKQLLAGEGKLALNTRLRAALVGVVDAVALPRRWRYLDQMPVNAQGKTTLAALLALLVNDAAPAGLSHLPRMPHLRELERSGADDHPQRVLLEISAPANLLYFDGHFTQAPILPGVVQVEWAIAYGRQYFNLPPVFRAIHALKFQNVIQPDLVVQLELLHDANKGSLNFRYLSDAGQHACGRILFHAGEAGV